MKIVHHHANGRFDWLISGQQSVNPSREAISILSVKYKTFTFVHPVQDSCVFLYFVFELFSCSSDRELLSQYIIRNSLKEDLIGVSFTLNDQRQNVQILICSPLKMNFLHLLSKFHGYIFNGLGKE